MSVRKMSLCRYSIPTLNVYSHILTFTKLSTYSVSVVKSNFDNFGGINPFMTPLGTEAAEPNKMKTSSKRRGPVAASHDDPRSG